MARVLIISSFVADGAVGGGVTQFVLNRLGHECILLPTILLSNHPGHARHAGEAVAPVLLGQMLDAYEDGGAINGIDAVFTGYMPSAAHAQMAAKAIDRVVGDNDAPRRHLICVDPILGDVPGGLYIPQAAARAIASDLVPRADIITPNRFELHWLSAWMRGEFSEGLERTIGPEAPEAPEALERANQGVLDDACRAITPDGLKQLASKIGVATAVVTSALLDDAAISSMLVEGESAEIAATRRFVHAPHGTGDFAAALFLGHRLNGHDSADAFSATITSVGDVIGASAGQEALRLVATQARWARGAAKGSRPVV